MYLSLRQGLAIHLGFFLHSRAQKNKEGWRKAVIRRPNLAVLKCSFDSEVVKRSPNRRQAGIGRKGERGREGPVFILLKTHRSSLFLGLPQSSHEEPADPFWSFYSATFHLPFLCMHSLTQLQPWFYFFPLQVRSPQSGHVNIVWCEKHPKTLLATKILPWFRTSLHWPRALSYIKKMLFKNYGFFPQY